MKYVKGYSLINESSQPIWAKDVIDLLNYEKEDDIKLYFIELLDLNWQTEPTVKTVSGDNFKLDNQRLTYLKTNLYKLYTIKFITNRRHSMSIFIEIMDTISESLERLQDNGYILQVKNLSLGIIKEKIIEIDIYHKDDIVDFNDIFISKNKR